MPNVFNPTAESHFSFRWNALGDIARGREHLGEDMPVLVYRMLEYSLNDVLFREFGQEKTNEIFRRAGHLCGMQFAENMLPLQQEPGVFISALQKMLTDLKIGILRLEQADMEKQEFIITVHEDLDCSGLPPSGELVCTYDEGFIAGILERWIGKPFTVREMDCWASGSKVCRFSARPSNETTQY